MAVAGVAACVLASAGVCLGVAVAGAAISAGVAAHREYKKTKSIKKAIWSGARAGVKDFAIGYIGGKVAGAKYVARYFGTIKKTGTARYYRSFAKAIKKAPVRQRAYRQIGAGAVSYAYQRWGW